MARRKRSTKASATRSQGAIAQVTLRTARTYRAKSEPTVCFRKDIPMYVHDKDLLDSLMAQGQMFHVRMLPKDGGNSKTTAKKRTTKK